jgi:hypothetical protein
MKRAISVVLCLSLFALAAPAVFAQAKESAGTVTISYNLFHPHWVASNQLAVWIEDSHGAYLKTVFATNYMARRKGYIVRPQCCPEWVKVSGLASLSAAAVDAISGATQKPGRVEVKWDGTGADGKPVPAGVYTYKVEGNISWDRRVIWKGTIEIGSAPSASVATPTYIPDAARSAGTLLTEVGAKFQPSN